MYANIRLQFEESGLFLPPADELFLNIHHWNCGKMTNELMCVKKFELRYPREFREYYTLTKFMSAEYL